MGINKLAEITAGEFTRVHGQMDRLEGRMDQVDNKIDQLVDGQKRILEIVLDLPSKKVIEKLTHKVEDIDDRVTVVERKLHTAISRG